MTIIYSMEYEEGTTEKTTEKVDEFSLNGKELARSWQGVRRGLQYSKGYRRFLR